MSLKELAVEILQAAEAVEQELDVSSKPVRPAQVRPSFIKRLSKRSRHLARTFVSCFHHPTRGQRRNSITEKGKRIETPSRSSDESDEICQLNAFERYSELPESLESKRDLLINKCHQLRTLIESPGAALTNIYTNWTELVSLEAVCHFRLFEAVPVLGSATYAEIATTAQIPQELAFRFIRTCIPNGIFCEPTPGNVHHTPRSRWLLTSGTGLLDLIALNYYELAPAGLRYIEAIEKYNATEEPNQSPFALANNNMGLFETLATDEMRRLRFGHSMQYLTSGDSFDLKFILKGYDWADYDTPGARVLDVGGGLGHISALIAAHTKELHFVVQDLPPVVNDAIAAKSNLGEAQILDRISFLPLSFFAEHSSSTPPIDIIFLRWIIHNWSDKYVRQILRTMIPVLRKGSQIFFVEYFLDEESPGVNATDTLGLRMDMIMGVGFAAKERTVSSLQALMDEVAQEFGGSWSNWNVRKPEGSVMKFVRVTWNGVKATNS